MRLATLCAMALTATANAQWIMVVNNTFECCAGAGNGPSIILVKADDGTLVDRDWIVPRSGEGNWDGNCSAQDAVQVGSQIWIGSSNANCPDPAAIYIYDVDFAVDPPVATFANARFFTVDDIGIAGLQPRGMHYDEPTDQVFVVFDTFPDLLRTVLAMDTTGTWTGPSLPDLNYWGITKFNGELVVGVIGGGGINRYDTNLNFLGQLVPPSSAGFWPYELDVDATGELLASGFTASTPYGIRAWDSAGAFVADRYAGAQDLRGMAVLGNGNYLIAHNSDPKSLSIWDGQNETDVITATGTGVNATLAPYMMGYLNAPGCAADIDGDGDADSDDFFAYLDLFAAGC